MAPLLQPFSWTFNCFYCNICLMHTLYYVLFLACQILQKMYKTDIVFTSFLDIFIDKLSLE